MLGDELPKPEEDLKVHPSRFSLFNMSNIALRLRAEARAPGGEYRVRTDDLLHAMQAL